MPFLMFLFSTV